MQEDRMMQIYFLMSPPHEKADFLSLFNTEHLLGSAVDTSKVPSSSVFFAFWRGVQIMSDNKKEMSSAETLGENQHNNNDLVIVPRDDIKELENVASELIRLMGMIKFGNQSESGEEGEQQLRQAFKIFKKEAPGWEGIIAKCEFFVFNGCLFGIVRVWRPWIRIINKAG